VIVAGDHKHGLLRLAKHSKGFILRVALKSLLLPLCEKGIGLKPARNRQYSNRPRWPYFTKIAIDSSVNAMNALVS